MIAWGSIISLAVGGLFGLLQKWLDLQTQKQQAVEKDKDRTHQLAVIDLEAKNAERRLTVEMEVEQSRAAGEAFTLSQKYGNMPQLPANMKLTKAQSWWLVIPQGLSGMIRPASTIYYQLLYAAMGIWIAILLSQSGTAVMDADFGKKMAQEMILSTVYLAEMTLGWWFGVSPVRKRK